MSLHLCQILSVASKLVSLVYQGYEEQKRQVSYVNQEYEKLHGELKSWYHEYFLFLLYSFRSDLWLAAWVSIMVETDVHKDRKDKNWSGVYYGGSWEKQPGLTFPGANFAWIHGPSSFCAFNGHNFEHGSLPVKGIKIMAAMYT